ncbi:MAG: hypothetical protein AB1Z23_11410 [Eubacteriales bacterium]
MRVISSEANWTNLPVINLIDENHQKIISCEDESSVLGNKICVYSSDGSQIYFLDEDLTYDTDVFNIQQNGKVITVVKRSDSMVHSGISIETKLGKFEYSTLSGVLQKDGQKIAKIIKRTQYNEMRMEVYIEEQIEYIATMMFVIQLLLK